MLRRIIVLACAVGLAFPALASAASPPPVTPKAKAASVGPLGGYNASELVCARNATGAFYMISPYITPRDTTQNGWVGFYDEVYRKVTGGWSKRWTSPMRYHYAPADIFEQATQANSWAWQDQNGNVNNGDFQYTGIRGAWYTVITYYIWYPQQSYPYQDSTALSANQDPYGVSARGRLCQAGVDNFGD